MKKLAITLLIVLVAAASGMAQRRGGIGVHPIGGGGRGYIGGRGYTGGRGYAGGYAGHGYIGASRFYGGYYGYRPFYGLGIGLGLGLGWGYPYYGYPYYGYPYYGYPYYSYPSAPTPYYYDPGPASNDDDPEDPYNDHSAPRNNAKPGNNNYNNNNQHPFSDAPDTTLSNRPGTNNHPTNYPVSSGTADKVWVKAHWKHTDNGWVYIEGYWKDPSTL